MNELNTLPNKLTFKKEFFFTPSGLESLEFSIVIPQNVVPERVKEYLTGFCKEVIRIYNLDLLEIENKEFL